MIIDLSKETTTDEMLKMPNYDKINATLEEIISKSINWLDNAIYLPKKIKNHAVYKFEKQE